MTDLVSQQQQEYQFSAKPQVVKDQGNRYRELPNPPSNIMWDKRVVRGNTYSSIVTQKGEQQVTVKVVRRRPRLEEQQYAQQDEEAQKGKFKREHQEVQTDENVEDLTDKPPTYQKESQTDFIIEREVPRLYMKVKTGVDKETQVWDDGELFNFDYEVEPLLQQLLGRTLEVARMEVLQEEELREMREQQDYYTQLRISENAEQQRMEDVERKLHEDNLKKKSQFLAKKKVAIKAHEKLVSRVLAKQFLSRVSTRSLDQLNQQGFFRSEIEVELQIEFLPWLYTEVQSELQQSQQVEINLDSILEVVQHQLTNTHDRVHKVEMKNRAEILEVRERQRVETEERNARRREARRIRLEKERRQKIKDNVIEKIVSKVEAKPNALGGSISDMDGYQQGTPFLGLFGGFIGELIVFLSALNEMGNDGSFISLRSLFTIQESLDEFFNNLMIQLTQTAETFIEVGILAQAEVALEALQPGLTIQALSGEKVTAKELNSILQQNFYSTTLACIKENYMTFGIGKDIIDMVESQLLKHIVANDLVRPKIKFQKVSQQKLDQICVALVKPNLAEAQFNPKSGKTRPEPSIDADEPQPEVVNPINLVEADVENKASQIVAQADDLKILVVHSVTELQLRQLILDTLDEVITLEPNSDYNILLEATNRCEALQNAILDVMAPELPLIELGVY